VCWCTGVGKSMADLGLSDYRSLVRYDIPQMRARNRLVFTADCARFYQAV
jgi:hypothetical protein